MAYALNLPDALRARGLVVEVVPGWETRSAGSFAPHGAVCHWTAGPSKSKTRPSLNICVNGRAGLPGPLCNVYLDRNGVAVVVAAGRANHAGLGDWKGLVGNSAVFGTEAEASGPDDWTDAQRVAYPKVNAAYADIGGFGADMVCGHSEWADVRPVKDGKQSRKSDINGWPMSEMRSSVANILAGKPGTSTGGFLMSLSDAEQHEVLDRLRGSYIKERGYDMLQSIEGAAVETLARVRGDVKRPYDMLQSIEAVVAGQSTALNVLAAAVAEGRDDLTAEELKVAVKEAIAEGVVKVDVSVSGSGS